MFVNLDSQELQTIQKALQKLLQASTPQQSLQVFLQHPELLTEAADAVFDMLITQARDQGRQSFVKALSGLQKLAREVRQNQQKG